MSDHKCNSEGPPVCKEVGCKEINGYKLINDYDDPINLGNIRFTIEGPRHRLPDVKRGLALKYHKSMGVLAYLDMFKRALDALYNHEAQSLGEVPVVSENIATEIKE